MKKTVFFACLGISLGISLGIIGLAPALAFGASNSYLSRAHVDAHVASFQALTSDIVYAVDSSGNLWRDVISTKSHVKIDGNVKAAQPLSGAYWVYVLGADGKLWLEPNGTTNRILIASGVAQFQAFELGRVLWKSTTNDLWYQVASSKTKVDGNVNSFRATDVTAVYVLGSDWKLWNEDAAGGRARTQVDSNVAQYFPVDAQNAYVEGTDSILWNENGNAGDRRSVDAQVAKFYPVDATTIFVTGGDGVLWREVRTMDFRDRIDANVQSMQPMGSAVFVLGNDGNLWLEQLPAAPVVFWSSLKYGPSTMGLWPNGDTLMTGNFGGCVVTPWTDKYQWTITSHAGEVFTFTHVGHQSAGCQNDIVRDTGHNPEIIPAFPALQSGASSVLYGSIN